MSGRKPGFPARQVTVIEMHPEQGFALCQEPTTKRQVQVTLTPRSERGLPRVGEVWVILHQVGNGTYWVFDSYMAGPIPSVTGSRAASDPLSRSMLAALVELGLVTDQTTA